MVLTFTDGEVPQFALDRNAIVDGVRQNGVISGLAVSQRGAGANLSVDVAIGECFIDDVRRATTAVTNVVISASHATLLRRDIITFNSATSAPVVIAGIASATPNPPTIPTGHILLALVEVPAGATAIFNANIRDKRMFVRVVQSRVFTVTTDAAGEVSISLVGTVSISFHALRALRFIEKISYINNILRLRVRRIGTRAMTLRDMPIGVSEITTPHTFDTSVVGGHVGNAGAATPFTPWTGGHAHSVTIDRIITHGHGFIDDVALMLAANETLDIEVIYI